MKPFRTLIVSVVFPPDGVSTAQLVGEIATDLAASGHEVTVLTSQPHYNEDVVARQQQPIRWHASRLFGTSKFGEVQVVHVRMGAKSSRVLGRILQWLWFHLASFVLSLRLRSDVCLAVSPPPTLAVQSAVRRALGGPPFVYAVWEAYPDVLFALGLLRPGSVVGRAARWIEGWTYRRADHIMFLSQAMLDAAREREPHVNVVGTMVPTFVDVESFSPQDRSTTLRSELSISDDQVVFGYAGNLGPAQDLSVLLDAAERLQDRTDLVVLICGAGSDEATVKQRASQLSNVVFAGHLPFQRMPEVYATFDVSVVALSAGLSSEALPSKAYRSMACGRPLLAISDTNSALAGLVRSSACGVVTTPNVDSVVDAIETMLRADRSGWGDAARAAVVQTASRSVVTARIGRILEDVGGCPPRAEGTGS